MKKIATSTRKLQLQKEKVMDLSEVQTWKPSEGQQAFYGNLPTTQPTISQAVCLPGLPVTHAK